MGTYLLAPSWSRIYQKMPSVTNRWYIAHGNTRALVDDNGALTDWFTYEAWGSLVASHSNVVNDNPFRWNGSVGYRYIAATGLYHAGAREYDPSVGRWLQRDPIGMAGGHPNLYVYCANNPVEAADPAGLRHFSALGRGYDPPWSLESRVDEALAWLGDGLYNGVIGLGDGVSFGATDKLREWWDLNDYVDQDSGWYRGGKWGGYALDVIIAGGLQSGASVFGVGARLEKFRRAGGGLSLYVGKTRAVGLDLHPIPVFARTPWLPHLHLWPWPKVHSPWDVFGR